MKLAALAHESPEAKMGLRDFLNIVRKRWFSIALITFLGGALAAGVSYTMPKTYSATAQNFVALTGDPQSGSVLNSAQFAAQRVKSYTEIVSSPDVTQPVIDDLGLTMTAAGLASKVSVTNPPGTVLLLVTAVDGSPQLAATIANAVSIQLGRVIEQLETPNSQSVAPVKVTLTEPATPPGVPVSPKIRNNILLGLLIGVGLGLGWAFLRNALDVTVKSETVLNSLVTAPALGTVMFNKSAKQRPLSALETKSAVSEGYRTIRTNLQFINVDNPVRAIAVTSAAPGDGKSTVACNLAIAMAQTEKKVCLVEADLRRPWISQYLQFSPATGLTDVLAGQVDVAQALHPWGRGLLTLMAQGTTPPNPSELLGSRQMGNVIEELKSRFDLVIFDTPPLLAVSDAAVLASQIDGALLVVRYGKTPKEAVRNAARALNQVDARILGTVLSAAPRNRAEGYGYDYGDGKIAGFARRN